MVKTSLMTRTKTSTATTTKARRRRLHYLAFLQLRLVFGPLLVSVTGTEIQAQFKMKKKMIRTGRAGNVGGQARDIYVMEFNKFN